MKTLQIEIPAGYEIEEFDKSTGKVSFREKPKDITERILSVQDAIDYLGEDDPEVIIYKKILPVFEDEPDNHLLNYQTAVVLIRAFNEKREPNWDINEPKYACWFEMGGSCGFRFGGCDGWGSYSDVGSRLCLFKNEHGNILAETFFDVFKNFMLIKNEK